MHAPICGACWMFQRTRVSRYWLSHRRRRRRRYFTYAAPPKKIDRRAAAEIPTSAQGSTLDQTLQVTDTAWKRNIIFYLLIQLNCAFDAQNGVLLMQIALL